MLRLLLRRLPALILILLVLAASVFHFGELSIGDVKQALHDAGHAVR